MAYRAEQDERDRTSAQLEELASALHRAEQALEKATGGQPVIAAWYQSGPGAGFGSLGCRGKPGL